MLPYRDSRLTTLLLGIFFILALLYALFEARGQLIGPIIVLNTRVAVMQDPLLIIEGHTERISMLSMNGREIPVTENGSFREPYLLAPGYNRIVLSAEDSYGRSTERVLEIMYTPDEDINISSAAPSPVQATSTTPIHASPRFETRSTSATSTTIESTASSTTPVAPMQ